MRSGPRTTCSPTRSMRLKEDAKDIYDFIAGLSRSLSLDPARRWWPRWLYRSDHIENAARILNTGVLLSRAAAESQGVIVKDSGSREHLRTLTPVQRQYVRLYFRPRTPTQFINEGIRPAERIQYDAHMPVPVYLLFSPSLLMEDGISYTRGRLTPHAETGDTADFLRSIPFKDVYHDTGVGGPGSTRRPDILHARNAEVLIRHTLPLDRLKRIVCRSIPERDTLITLLDARVRDRWIGNIIVDEGALRIFNRRTIYIQKVVLSSTTSSFDFYSDIEAGWRGPFHLHIAWNPHNWSYSDDGFVVSPGALTIRLPRPSDFYRVRITMNGDLVYLGAFEPRENLPF